MCAAHRRSEPALAPPTALPRTSGLRDRLRAARARRREGVDLAPDVTLGRRVTFDLAAGARLTIASGVALDDGCRFHLGAGAEVTVGPSTRRGERCVVTAHERITIGARCLLADEVVLADGAPQHGDVERPTREQGLTTAPVAVGDGVRVGPGAAILRGVTVAAGATIGAHAVVTHDVAGDVEGAPARPPVLSPPPRAPRARADHERR